MGFEADEGGWKCPRWTEWVYVFGGQRVMGDYRGILGGAGRGILGGCVLGKVGVAVSRMRKSGVVWGGVSAVDKVLRGGGGKKRRVEGVLFNGIPGRGGGGQAT